MTCLHLRSYPGETIVQGLHYQSTNSSWSVVERMPTIVCFWINWVGIIVVHGHSRTCKRIISGCRVAQFDWKGGIFLVQVRDIPQIMCGNRSFEMAVLVPVSRRKWGPFLSRFEFKCRTSEGRLTGLNILIKRMVASDFVTIICNECVPHSGSASLAFPSFHGNVYGLK